MSPKKKKVKGKGKPITEMTSDELAEHLFSKKVVKKIKEIVRQLDEKKK